MLLTLLSASISSHKLYSFQFRIQMQMQILCFYLIFQPTAFKVEKHGGGHQQRKSQSKLSKLCAAVGIISRKLLVSGYESPTQKMTVNDDNAAENNFQLLSKSKCSITSLCIEATASQCLKITTKKSHFYNIVAILLLFIEIDPTNGVKIEVSLMLLGHFWRWY